MDSAEFGATSGNDEFPVIELHMLKQAQFFPLATLGSFSVQVVLHPLSLLRTRLQLQHHHDVYRGLWHAANDVVRREGWLGLYNGFFTKSTQLVSGIVYVTVYESTRARLAQMSRQQHSQSSSLLPSIYLSAAGRSFVAGGLASAAAQTLLVPVDVVSQHLMLLPRRPRHPQTSSPSTTWNGGDTHKQNNGGRSVSRLTPLRLSASELSSPARRVVAVVRHLRLAHGWRAFYQGYVISLACFVPNSALWWAFYHKYCDWLSALVTPQLPGNTPNRLAVQLLAAPLAGITSVTVLNPVDLLRVRMQVQHTSFRTTLTQLWASEGWRLFGKGLSARATMSALYSFWLILAYEPIKVYCLRDEYRDTIRL